MCVQYWCYVNTTRKETFGTHEFGVGLKFLEQMLSRGHALANQMLLCDTRLRVREWCDTAQMR